MEYLLSIKTKDDQIVNFIINQQTRLSKMKYIEEFGEMSQTTQEIMGKKYIVIADTLDVDPNILIGYLDNKYENTLNHDLLKIMLYFMDSQIEETVKYCISSVMDNKYDGKTNLLLYSHFNYMFNDLMILRGKKFNKDTGDFYSYDIDPFDYKGEELVEFDNRYNTHPYYTHPYYRMLSKNTENKLKVIVGTIITPRTKKELTPYNVYKTSVINVLNDDYNMSSNKNLESFYTGISFQFFMNKISVVYPKTLGKLSNLILYAYDNYNNSYKNNNYYNTNIKILKKHLSIKTETVKTIKLGEALDTYKFPINVDSKCLLSKRYLNETKIECMFSDAEIDYYFKSNTHCSIECTFDKKIDN